MTFKGMLTPLVLASFLGAAMLQGNLSAAAPITGAFVDFNRNMSQTDINREVDEMYKLGIRNLYVLSVGQQAADGSLGGAIYPSQYLAGAAPADKLGWVGQAIASKSDMFLYLGSLQTQAPWYTVIPGLRQRNLDVMREIYNRPQYQSWTGRIKGVYLTQEIWLNQIKIDASYRQSAYDLALGLSLDARTVKPEWLSVAAPYFKKYPIPGENGNLVPGIQPFEYASIIRDFVLFAQTRVMPQDGPGAGDGAPLASELLGYHSAIWGVFGLSSQAYGVTVEVFEHDATVGVNTIPNLVRQLHSFRPLTATNINRLKEQISSAYCGVLVECVMWNFGHHMSSAAAYEPDRATALRMAYAKAYNIYGEKLLSFTYGGTEASSQYPDNGRLNDGKGGGYNGNINYDTPPTLDVAWNTQNGPGSFVGWNSTSQVELNLNLGWPAKQVKRVEFLLRGEADGAVMFPTSASFFGDSVLWGTVSITDPTPNQYNVRLVSFSPTTPVFTQNIRLLLNKSYSPWLHIAEVRVIGVD